MVNRPRRSKVVSPMCGGADTTGSPKRAVVRGSFTFRVQGLGFRVECPEQNQQEGSLLVRIPHRLRDSSLHDPLVGRCFKHPISS